MRLCLNNMSTFVRICGWKRCHKWYKYYELSTTKGELKKGVLKTSVLVIFSGFLLTLDSCFSICNIWIGRLQLSKRYISYETFWCVVSLFIIWLAPWAPLWLATRAGKMLGTTRLVPQEKFPQKPYNKSFIDQACSFKMAWCWPRSFFTCLWTSTPSRSTNTQKKTRPISSHLDLTLGH